MPGHKGIIGRLLTDSFAKNATNIAALQDLLNSCLSLKSAAAWVEDILHNDIQQHWSRHAPLSCKNLHIDSFEHCPRKLSLPRSLTAHL